MSYAVLDLEFNQSFNFNDGNEYMPNPKCRFEIIQIGAVKLDNNFNITNELEITIKPQIYKRLHPIVEKITGLEQKDFKRKKTFPIAYEKLLKFLHKDDILCFWGPGDIKALYRNIIFYNLPHYNIQPRFINIQRAAGKFLEHPASTAIGLENAITTLGINTNLPFHNALNDAKYTAFVLQAMKNIELEIIDFDLGQLEKNETIINSSSKDEQLKKN